MPEEVESPNNKQEDLQSLAPREPAEGDLDTRRALELETASG